MTVTENLLSASITDYNAVPPLRIASGQGSPGFERVVNDFVTSTALSTTSSTYRILRVPASCIIKDVIFDSAAAGGSSAVNVGVFYSNDPLDPSYDQEAGAAISAAFFASALSTVSAVTNDNITNQAGNYGVNLRNEPLWEALGLTYSVETNPWLMDAYFDIVISPSTELTNSVLMGLKAIFVQPGD